MAKTTELERIVRLAARFGTTVPGIALGIGDDAAVLEPPTGKKLVWTVDAQVQGVHFTRDFLGSWRDAGYRSFMAAASDLAAMGACPWCALSALELSDAIDDAALDDIAEGQRAAAAAIGAGVIGGNLSRGPVLAITTTLLGTADEPISRGGARPGDGVWLAGGVGLAAAGLRALQNNVRDRRVDPAVDAWRAPTARIADGLLMAKLAHAAIDISDGLACDVGHVVDASGVRIVLDAEAIVAHAGDVLVRAADAVGATALDLALHGGEDYALVATSAHPIPGFSRIGDVVAGRGLALRTRAGEAALAPRGFDHFA